MTYILEPFIEKIESPIIIKYDGREFFFNDGQEAARLRWHELTKVTSIKTQGDFIVLVLEKINQMPVVNWAGEEAVSFF